jgi:SAM-dependent methyltransferase
MTLFERVADNQQPKSLATKMRQKRFAFYLSLLATVPRPVKILDVGGTQNFWDVMGFTNTTDVKIVLLNLTEVQVNYPNFSSVAGDACNMKQFGDKEFDVVFSNSVIEHVGNYAAQLRMAEEVQRVGKRYFIQTPNRYFPIEPHFLFPYYQFLPLILQVFLIRHFNLGWYRRIPDRQDATAFVKSHTLLSERELRRLFPNAALYKERFLGFTKSFVLYHGFVAATH